MKCVTVSSEIKDNKNDPGLLAAHIILLVFGLGILAYIWFGIIPGILLSYTITTNVSKIFQSQAYVLDRNDERSRNYEQSHRPLKIGAHQEIVQDLPSA
jgi:hypothetical protein